MKWLTSTPQRAKSPTMRPAPMLSHPLADANVLALPPSAVSSPVGRARCRHSQPTGRPVAISIPHPVASSEFHPRAFCHRASHCNSMGYGARPSHQRLSRCSLATCTNTRRCVSFHNGCITLRSRFPTVEQNVGLLRVGEPSKLRRCRHWL